MNFLSFKAALKGGILALVHEAEEQLVGEKVGAQRKAWVKAAIKETLTKAGIYGYKVFGVFDTSKFLDAVIDGLIEWAVGQLKAGVDVLEKL